MDEQHQRESTRRTTINLIVGAFIVAQLGAFVGFYLGYEQAWRKAEVDIAEADASTRKLAKQQAEALIDIQGHAKELERLFHEQQDTYEAELTAERERADEAAEKLKLFEAAYIRGDNRR